MTEDSPRTPDGYRRKTANTSIVSYWKVVRGSRNNCSRTAIRVKKEVEVEICAVKKLIWSPTEHVGPGFAVESGNGVLNETAIMDSIPYCQVYMSDNHSTSRYFPIKDLNGFICTRKRNFNYCRYQLNCYSSNSCFEGAKYSQQLRHNGRPSQQCQWEPWKTSNQLRSSYRWWDFLQSAVSS